MKSGRLFEIVLLLVKKRKITALELAERFEVSVRTIYRDIETLLASGIPIYTTSGRDGGIHIMDDYVLERAMLSNNEREEIVLALNTLASIPNLQEGEVFRKVADIFDKNPDGGSRDWLDVDLSPWKSLSRAELDLFDTLKKAIEMKKSVEIKYVSTRFEESIRLVDPIKLVFKHKDWYLIAYCRKKNDFRMFKINRIWSIVVLQQDFNEYESLPEMYINDYMDRDKFEKVEIIFSMKVFYRVLDDFDRDMISRFDEERILVAGEVEVNDWLLSSLMSYGKDAYIKSPVNLRRRVMEMHREAFLNLSNGIDF